MVLCQYQLTSWQVLVVWELDSMRHNLSKQSGQLNFRLAQA